MKGIEIGDVLNWELKELYNYVLTIEEDLEEEDIDKIAIIRNGTEAFPLHIKYIIKEYYEEFPKNKNVNITGIGKVNLLKFWNYVEEVEKQLRTIIIDYLMDDDDITESRN